jgi:ribosome-interacting GTPase 1
MPANLSPEYLEAEQQYREAKTPAEKIAALERMLATIPKHKGTEKLQADIKRRLSQTRKEAQQKKGGAHATPFYQVEREGAGQVVLIGPPNAGKSQLLARLTNARPEVADYPFTTRIPLPGMMNFEDVQIQLVDLPPIAPEFTEPWLPQVLRYANLGVLMVDVNEPAVLEQIEYIEQRLDAWRVRRPGLLVANKGDLPGARENFQALEDLFGERYRCLLISAQTGEGLDRFARAVFEGLELVRVYTKAPGKKPDLTAPFVARRGDTVVDVARMVHKDFAEKLKFARLYRLDGDRDGIMVERTYVVQDQDILEFHI